MVSFYGRGGIGGGGGSTSTKIYICGSGEYDTITGLPTVLNPEQGVIYLVPTDSQDNQNLFNKYIYKDGQYESFGSGTIDIQTGLKNLVDGSAVGSVRGVDTIAENVYYTMGRGAFAEGSGTKASGSQSHAEGGGTTASGEQSHAEGGSTIASGLVSHAEGGGTTASGYGSHAEGRVTIASGDTSHAEGLVTVASGSYSHASGNYTAAIGDGSYAEGNYIDISPAHRYQHEIHLTGGANVLTYTYDQLPLGIYRIIQVNDQYFIDSKLVTITGLDKTNQTITISETLDATTPVNRNVIIIKPNLVSGQNSHAEGSATTASGYTSHAEGYNTIANHKSQHVFGEYNIEDPSAAEANNRGNYVEIVGNGTDNARSNARTLDWNGNEILAGKLTVGTDPVNNMDVATKQYVDTAATGVITLEIKQALLNCFSHVAWTDQNGSNYYNALRTALNIEESQDWTYIWNSSSQELPENLTYSSYSFSESESGALKVFGCALNFQTIGDCELEIECKWHYANAGDATLQNPQIAICTATGSSGNSGAKFFGNPSSGRNIQTNVSGSMVATSVSGDSYHLYNLKSANGVLILTIDGDVVSSGSGVSNNQYIPYTGIISNNVNGCGLYIKSIKFKGE